MRAKGEVQVNWVKQCVHGTHTMHWTEEDVAKLLAEYVVTREERRILEYANEAGDCELAEERWDEAGGGCEDTDSDGSYESAESDGSDDEEPVACPGIDESANADLADAEGDAEEDAERDAEIATQERSTPPAPVLQSPETAEAFHTLEDNITTLAATIAELRERGMVAAAHDVHNHLQRERRRLHALCREDPEVVRAMERRAILQEERESDKNNGVNKSSTSKSVLSTS